uniref:ATP synthase complex subunit 8 n=1 Tax=Proasellus coiffaiti TaxID=1281953 RepID=A0A485M9G8_9CRUS|nr:ATP synthase 8 [Proasellus coiffaiti]
MPQMAPLFWTVLMVMFYSILILFTVKLYFYPLVSNLLSNKSTQKSQNMPWQW